MTDNFEIAKDLLLANGEITGLTKGNSMKPLFRDGKDKAIILPLTAPLKPNDILLYRNNVSQDIVLHRVVKIKNGKLTLRGDNLFYNEIDIKKEDIIGVLKAFYRNRKYYECQKSTVYKIYTLYIRVSYPLRLVFHKSVSLLKRIKRKIKLLEK